MKKRFITLMLALAFVFCGMVTLTACNDDNLEGKTVYKLTNNISHCTYHAIGTNGGGGATASGQTYISDDTDLRIDITPDKGYYSNNISVTVNGEARPFLENERTETVREGYYSSISIIIENPTNNIEIVLSGNYVLASGNVKFETTDDYTEDDAQGTFIRFEQNSFGFPTEETALADFVKNYTTAKNIDATQGFSYYVYRKNYDKAPNEIRIDYTGSNNMNDGANYLQAYINETDGEYGYKYSYVHNYSMLEKINIEGSREIYKDIRYNEESIFSLNEGYTSSDNKVSVSLDLTTKTLTITLNDYSNIPQEVLQGLKLRVNKNETKHNINFATDGIMNETSKIYTVNLEECYKYCNENDAGYYSYYYEVDLNTYEFPTWFTNTLPYENMPA